tara:strand:- start:400 stop:735 length:336 start_codon:yes stop_codon:yes gene_type:complete
MPNQYNAVSLTEETYPHAVGTHTAGAVYPNMASSGLVSTPGTGAAITQYKDVGVVSETTTRNPQPTASGVGGPNSVALTSALDGGTGTSQVIDRDDAAFGTNEDPYLSSNV